MNQIFVSAFDHKRDAVPKEYLITRQSFAARIKQPHIRTDKDGAAFAPSRFEPKHRRKENVVELSMLVFDIDYQIQLADLRAKLEPLDAALDVYSTFSHCRRTDKNPNAETRWRVLIYLAENVPAADYETLWQIVNRASDLRADEQARDVSRLHYAPAKADAAATYEYFIADNNRAFDWRAFLVENQKPPQQADERYDGATAPLIANSFEYHETRNDELKRLIEQRAKRTRNGFEMRCPAHNGNGSTSLWSALNSPAVKCLKGCDYFDILRAFGLSDERLPSRDNQRSQTGALGSDTATNSEEPFAEITLPKLADAALYGLAGDIVRIIEPHTESDNAALLVQLLAGFGSLINKTAHFRAENDLHFTKINVVLVGASSKGRKGSSFGQIRRLLTRIDETFANCIQDGLSSGEGLIYHVRDRQEKETPIKEKGRITGYQTETVDEGAKEKRAFVVEPEFARVLRAMQRDGNTLSSVIRQAWDSDRLRVMTKNPVKASDAQITIVGHITRDELRRNLDDTETANGFANRFLWTFTRRSKLLPEGGDLPETDLNPVIIRLHKAREFAITCGELKRDRAAREKWIAVYPQLSGGATGLLGSVTSRAESQTMRLACLFAVLDCSNEIRLEHLNAALAVWQYCEDSARYIFGNQTGDKVADEIFTALQGAQETGLDKTQIRDLFARHAKANEINRALKMLLELGRIEQTTENTGGRPREVFKVLNCDKSDKSDKYQQEETDNKPFVAKSAFVANETENKTVKETENGRTEKEKLFDTNPLRETVNAPTAQQTKTYDCLYCPAKIMLELDVCPECGRRQYDF